MKASDFTATKEEIENLFLELNPGQQFHWSNSQRVAAFTASVKNRKYRLMIEQAKKEEQEEQEAKRTIYIRQLEEQKENAIQKHNEKMKWFDNVIKKQKANVIKHNEKMKWFDSAIQKQKEKCK
jgi:hypothetical protein